MENIVEMTGRDGRVIMKMQRVGGMNMPAVVFENMQERHKKLKTLKANEGDVIIANFPKTGTHWLMDSIAMLKRGKAELVHHIGFEGFLDAMQDLEKLDQEEGSRVLMTHMFHCHLSEDFQQKSKFIIALRNPKDTAVSMYYMLKRERHNTFGGTWDEFFEVFFKRKDQATPCNFFDYYRKWQEFALLHQDQCLIIYYEDMQKNYEKELRRIADFMTLNITDETICEIAKKGTFKSVTEELKTDPKIMAFVSKFNSDGSLLFHRKGIVGDWRNHFTVAQNEEADQIIEKETEGSIFKYDFSL